LAELIKYYHQHRREYLTWSAEVMSEQSVAILNYQRALLTWYEACLRRDDPYTGEVAHFIRAAATHYAGRETEFRDQWQQQGLAGLAPDPMNYLPRAVELSKTQTRMLQQFRELGSSCRELLLLAYYHRLSDAKIAEVLELGVGEKAGADKRRQCLLMVREHWQQTALLDPVYSASPEQWEQIDAFQRGKLDVAERWEVEALRSSDTVFRDALLLREDWEDCLQLAGRQDTLETLRREEDSYQVKVELPTQTRRQPNPLAKIKGLQTYLIGILLAVLAWMLLSTFGPQRETRLYTKYFTPFPNITKANQRAVDPVEEELAEMLAPYDQGDYLLAYDELLPAANAYPSAPIYLGVCALALKEPQRAIQWFEQYLPGDRFHPYARWYEALAYLAAGRSPAALGILLEIAGQAGHPYETQATELIEALE